MHYILFHNNFDKLAGTERVLYNIIEFLSQNRSVKITLLLAGVDNGLAMKLDSFSINIVYLDQKFSGTGFMSNLTYHLNLCQKVSKFFRAFKDFETSICIATNPLLAAVVYYSCSYRQRKWIKVVSCEHFALDVAGSVSKVTRKVLYKNIYVVCLTNRDKVEIEYRYKPKLCVCIPNAIPFATRPYEYNSDKKKILAVGRLTFQKGFDLLIESFSLIANKHSDWELVIVGDDYGDKTKLIALKHEYKIKNLEIIPATASINEHYRSSAFLVLSSRFEGLPMVMLEAMGFGLPIVAFDCPTGPAELVDDNNGYLVRNGDLKAFAESMEALITNSQLLLSKARGSELRSSSYKPEKINKLWSSLFTRIAGDLRQS